MRLPLLTRHPATTCDGDPEATLIMSTKSDPSVTQVIMGVETLVQDVLNDEEPPSNPSRSWENGTLTAGVVSIIAGSMLILGTLLADSWVGRLLNLGLSLLS